jgi:hypothetical protein
MKIAFFAILLTFIQSAFAADIKTSGVIYSVPDGFSISNQLNMQTDQFRNANGESWTITVVKLSSNQPAEQQKNVGSIEKKEQELGMLVEMYKKRNLIHHFEKRSLQNGATLLLLGKQVLRTGNGMPPGGQLYSDIDFYISWDSGFLQLNGHIEWPGELKPNLENCISRIVTIRKDGQANNSVELHGAASH